MSNAHTPANTTRQAAAGTVRPATALGLVYKAFRRPYGGTTGAPVLELFASGYYNDAPWVLSFAAVPGEQNTYVLNEQVPTIVHFLVTYYVASYTSGYGMPDLGPTVTIVDAHGRHTVPVEPIG